MIWTALTVSPQRERRVADEIRRGLGLQVCVPCATKHRKSRGKGGRPQLIPYLLPLMPSYVFVGSRNPLPLYDLKATEHVRGFVRFGGVIASLSDAEIDRMRRLAKDADIELPSGYKVGDQIKITVGPFASFERLIAEIKDGDVRIDVELFGRTVEKWFRPDQFEKAEAA